MPADVTGDFSAAGGVAHMDCVLQVKLFSQRREIVGVGVHLVAIPGLGGTAVAPPVMRDDAITVLAEKEHLGFPVIRTERPAVAEHHGLTFAPVFVVDRRAIFHCNSAHEIFSFD